MNEKIKQIPKVELHLHLDGSISPTVASQLSGLSLAEVTNKMMAKDKCKNLSEYLTKFDFPISIMQTKENLKQIAKSVVDYLEEENVIYAEIRFAPIFHTKEGLTKEEVVEAVLEGLNTNKKVKTNLILCMMRGLDREFNLQTISLVEKYLNKGVCALDLAGAEDKYPLDDYKEFFEIAASKQIPFTIHAGENGSALEVQKAIELGASRIGHGIHAIENAEVLNLIKEKNVLLEICPTSNVQTNAIPTYKDNPIYNFYQNDICVNINTDNKTVSNITLSEEYQKVAAIFNLDLLDFQKMNICAIENSFLTSEEKKDLLTKIN